MNSNMDTPAPVVKRKRGGGGDREPVQAGQLLTRAQVMFREKIGQNTLKMWEKMGLQMYSPPGKEFTTGDDVLEFVKRFPVARAAAEMPEKTAPKKKRKGN